MYYVLSTKILQGADTASGTSLKKGVLEFVVKILDKHTNTDFLKNSFVKRNFFTNIFQGF